MIVLALAGVMLVIGQLVFVPLNGADPTTSSAITTSHRGHAAGRHHAAGTHHRKAAKPEAAIAAEPGSHRSACTSPKIDAGRSATGRTCSTRSPWRSITKA